jgi:RNA 3'-terminal phosphate cyclase-like protein
VDSFRAVLLNYLKLVGIEGVEIKIIKRGIYPQSNVSRGFHSNFVEGEIELYCPIAEDKISGLNLISFGRIKKIRGMCFVQNANIDISNRCISTIRQMLNNFIPDVWVLSNMSKTQDSK